MRDEPEDILLLNYRDKLNPIENGLAAASADRAFQHKLLSRLDDDLYALLLLKSFSGYPNIRNALANWPDRDVQVMSVGDLSLRESVGESLSFYKKVCDWQAEFGALPIGESKVLDYGCGWGRIIRFFAKRVALENLFGCDPNSAFVDLCRALGVPGSIKLSDWASEARVFDCQFDLIYSFSILTHASETLHLNILQRIKEMLRRGGLFIATIRPGMLLEHSTGEMIHLSPSERSEWRSRFRAGEFLFKAYDGSPNWGIAVVPESYLSSCWSQDFDLLQVGHLYRYWTQIPVLLRRK